MDRREGGSQSGGFGTKHHHIKPFDNVLQPPSHYRKR